ncbi:MAG: hypothetical protein LBT97_06620 [Planctomycetota bacterium]|nr:hypothetical protein [Planctomycetota bacterium]
MMESVHEVALKARHHIKLRSTARALGMLEAHVFGHLLFLWLGAREYAEDGDLWRGDENASLRFIRVLAGEPADIEAFVATLQMDRWLDGWLLHDWPDHAGKYLIDRYKSRRRKRLVEIWAKHGRVYGRDSPSDDEHDDDAGFAGSDREPIGKWAGSDREVSGNQTGSEREIGGNDPGTRAIGLPPQYLQCVVGKEVTLNPTTLKNKKKNNPYNPINNPIGGCGA